MSVKSFGDKRRNPVETALSIAVDHAADASHDRVSDAEVVSLSLSHEEYELWASVTWSINDTNVCELDPDVTQKIKKSLTSGEETYRRVETKRSALERRTGRVVEITRRPGPLRQRARALTPVSGRDIFLLIKDRAESAGLPVALFLRKRPGIRHRRHEKFKRTRALVALELADRGASYTEIGLWLGGVSKQAVVPLVERGRAERAVLQTRSQREYEALDPRHGHPDTQTSPPISGPVSE